MGRLRGGESLRKSCENTAKSEKKWRKMRHFSQFGSVKMLVENQERGEWGACPRTRRGGYDHIWGLRVAKERFLGVGVWGGGHWGVG